MIIIYFTYIHTYIHISYIHTYQPNPNPNPNPKNLTISKNHTCTTPATRIRSGHRSNLHVAGSGQGHRCILSSGRPRHANLCVSRTFSAVTSLSTLHAAPHDRDSNLTNPAICLS